LRQGSDTAQRPRLRAGGLAGAIPTGRDLAGPMGHAHTFLAMVRENAQCPGVKSSRVRRIQKRRPKAPRCSSVVSSIVAKKERPDDATIYFIGMANPPFVSSPFVLGLPRPP